MNIIKNLKFRQGSQIEKVYVLLEQGKTEQEIATQLSLDIKKVHSIILWIENKSKNNKNDNKETQITFSPQLPVSDEMKKYIPQQNGYLPRRFGKFTDIEILEKCYETKSFVLIYGETGTGKTHLVRDFAFRKHLPYARVNLNGGVTADELIGHWVPNPEGGFRWQDGILTTFVRNGGVIALDEVNSCPAEILFSLHSLTDDERTLTLISKDSEVVVAHPNFFLVATMNPDYEGTKPLNAAFKDRFKVKLNFEYNDKIEKKLISNTKLLDLADKLRVMKNKGEIVTPISTRMLLYYENNVKLFSTSLAIDLFLNNFEVYEKEAIKNVIELIGLNQEIIPEVK